MVYHLIGYFYFSFVSFIFMSSFVFLSFVMVGTLDGLISYIPHICLLYSTIIDLYRSSSIVQSFVLPTYWMPTDRPVSHALPWSNAAHGIAAGVLYSFIYFAYIIHQACIKNGYRGDSVGLSLLDEIGLCSYSLISPGSVYCIIFPAGLIRSLRTWSAAE